MDKRQVNLKNIKSRRVLTTRGIFTVIIVLACIVATVLWGSYANEKELEKQIQHNLADVASQNAMLLESKVTTEYELLESLSQKLEDVTPENIDEKLSSFEIFINNFNLKRFAYCFPDGMTYSTDGEMIDLDYREFYQAGMEGRCYITGILSDAILDDETPVNVVTKPVYDANGNVSGVFGLAYDTESFNDFLQLESFGGYGYSCIISEDCEIMAATKDVGLELSKNLLDDVLNKDTRNDQTIACMKEQIENKQKGTGVLYLSEKNYYYSTPVELMDGSVTWYVLTIVPEEVLKVNIIPIQKNASLVMVLVFGSTLVGVLMIILFMREQNRKISEFAYVDPVTGGSNYAKFCVEMSNADSRGGYLIFMDIANFNYVTIVAGEEAHDTMLKQTWNILVNLLNKDELAGHIKDEMFLLFLREDNEDMVLQRMEHISEKISKKAKEFHVYGIRATYGIYRMAEEETFENSCSKARIAKEYAITNPDSHYAFYSQVNGEEQQREKQLEEMFPAAISNEEFEVWYQPKYDAKDCTVVGSEALVRWRTEDGKMISPGEFIPLLERNGMISKLDEYMFSSVCRQQRKWLDEGKTIYPVSINISRATLYCIDVEKHYYDIIQKYNIEPQYVQLEITETVMDAKKDVGDLLNRFRKMGIKILMDDFGTGYASLATLSAQCFDVLKIDKSLIDHIGSKDGETILYHIISMAQQMGLRITAEGVESKDQLEFLQNIKCDDIQGFYFAKPMPVVDYEKIINNPAD